ncbi:MAG TPA: SAM-dependent methyltransferase [Pseudonocardiaceae bacterium]|nr:SAM-dependent methyltransferase [Pseudonocardiaceae bacterium]
MTSGESDLPDWVPEGVEVTVPNAARMYDYTLGGYHNFAVDREYIEKAIQAMPGIVAVAHANRAFVGRSVRWLVKEGVRQFLDIGSGIPTLGNVHEVAQEAAPDARVMYVDIDPVAVAHSEALLAGNDLAGVIQADLRQPSDILYHPDVLALLDFAQPVAVLLNAVMHFLPDSDHPLDIMAAIREALPSGGYVVMTHGTEARDTAREQERVAELYQSTPTSFHLRDEDYVRRMFDGFELVEPGITTVTAWRPDPDEQDDPPQDSILAVVGRKP